MKKTKRILAIVGIAVLLGLYITTLLLALFNSGAAFNMFKACLYATFVLPVLLYAYSFIYKLLKNNYSKDKKEDSSSKPVK